MSAKDKAKKLVRDIDAKERGIRAEVTRQAMLESARKKAAVSRVFGKRK